MMRWRRRFRGRRCPPVRRRLTNRVTGSAPGAASRGDGGPAGGATRPARTVAVDATTLVRRAASDGAPLLRPRLLPADAEPPAGPLFPCPRRPGRSRHCRAPGAPARRAVGGVADAGRHPTPPGGRRVPGDRGAEWRERLPRHPRRRGVAFRERPGGPRGLRRAARRAGASWRARDDDLPRPSRLLAARGALLLRGGVVRLAGGAARRLRRRLAHPPAAGVRAGAGHDGGRAGQPEGRAVLLRSAAAGEAFSTAHRRRPVGLGRFGSIPVSSGEPARTCATAASRCAHCPT